MQIAAPYVVLLTSRLQLDKLDHAADVFENFTPLIFQEVTDNLGDVVDGQANVSSRDPI
jgi:hypothetical protein